MKTRIILAAFLVATMAAWAGAQSLGNRGFEPVYGVGGGGGGGGDITAVGDCTSGDCLTSGTTTMAGAAVFSSTVATRGIHSFGSAAQATVSAAGLIATSSSITSTGGTIGRTNANDGYMRISNSTGGILEFKRDWGTTGSLGSVQISSVDHWRLLAAAGGVELNAPATYAIRLTGNLSVGVVSPASLSGSVTDYTGCATASMCRINDGGSARTINSMSINHTSSTAHAPIMNICSVGSNTLTLLHDDGVTGTASMRFTFDGTNRTVLAGSCFPVIYDPTTARWRAANGT